MLVRRLSVFVALTLIAACASAHAPVNGATSMTAFDASADDAGADDASAAEDADADASDADADAATEEGGAVADSSPCPRNMVLVADAFCIDRYEGALVETLADGTERPYPHYLPVDGHDVRAISESGVFPQSFISELQADDACQASGKRLCTHTEWKSACMGPGNTAFPYGNERTAGTCHDAGKSPVAAVFGAAALASPAPAVATNTRPSKPGKKGTQSTSAKGKPKKNPKAAAKGSSGNVQSASKSPKKATPARRSTRPNDVSLDVWTKLNDPRLGQVEGALSTTGSHPSCVTADGALDMVGNLHEWVSTDRSLPHGTFAGGYFLDTHLNGDGCNYRTVAHAHDYHDYSTGFRCCADLR